MNHMRRSDLRLTGYIAAVQLFLSVTLAATLSLLDVAVGLVAMTGGLIGLFASASFAFIALRAGQQKSAGKIVIDFYLGEMIKLALVIACLIMAFRNIPVVWDGLNVLALFGAYLLTQSANIIVPIMLSKK